MKRTSSIFLILLLMICTAIVPADASADDKGTFQKKTVTAYLYNKKDTAKIECLFFDDMPDIPYISADDYLNQIYTVKFSTEDNRNGTYTVKCDNGEMLVNTVKDTIHFDCLENILYYDSVDANETESANYVDWADDDFDYVGEQKSVDLDLGKYHLDLVGENGKAYFPLYTISDLFSDLYLSAIYRGGSIYFIRTQDDEAYYDDSEIYSELTRSQSMIDYTYNELCFSIDHFYGKPPKAEIAADIEEKGFDDAISEHDANTARAKDLLKSDSRVDFCKGLMMLDNYFDDGGHTMLSGGMIAAINSKTDTALASSLLKSMSNPTGNEDGLIFKPIIDITKEQANKSSLSTLKEEAYESTECVREWDDAKLYVKGNTAYFVFEEFKDAVVKPFKLSLDYCKENNIKNVVIDVTTNGGGAQAVVFYMLSVISGKSALYQLNTLTGNLYKEDPRIDRNLDGKFDEKDDALKYDLNFAILTTDYSFSSANMLPCIAQKNGVAVIGETSGGGTCALAMRFAPDGSYYYMSSDMKITYSDGKDIDAGATPNIKLDTSDGYEKFFDFDKIESGVEDFYKNPSAYTEPVTESETEDETQASTESATAAASESGESSQVTTEAGLSDRMSDSEKTIMYIVIGVMAAALIVVIILIVILVKRSKKKESSSRVPQPAQREPIDRQPIQSVPYSRPPGVNYPYNQPASPYSPYNQPASPYSAYNQTTSPYSPYKQTTSPYSPYKQTTSPYSPYNQTPTDQNPASRVPVVQNPVIQTQNGYPPINRVQNGYPPINRAQNGYPPINRTQNDYPPINRTQNGYPPINRTQNGYPPINRAQNGYSPLHQPQDRKESADRPSTEQNPFTRTTDWHDPYDQNPYT